MEKIRSISHFQLKVHITFCLFYAIDLFGSVCGGPVGPSEHDANFFNYKLGPKFTEVI